MKTARILSIILAVMLLLVCSGCGSQSTSQQPASTGAQTSSGTQDNAVVSTDAAADNTPYKFVLHAPLTGNNAQYGQAYRDTCNLLVEKVNSEGGINGHPVVLEIYDDKNDPKEAVNIASRVVGDDSVLAVIASQSSTTSMAAAPLYQEAGIVMISPQASHADLTKIGDYIFSRNFANDYAAKLMAHWIAENTQYKSVAFYVSNDDGGNANMENLSRDLSELGLKVVAKETFEQNATKDFSPILSKINAENPDLLFVTGSYTDNANQVIQARELGMTATIFGSDTIFTQVFVDLTGEEGEGVITWAGMNRNSEHPDYTWLVESLEAKGQSMSSYVTHSYDCLNLLIEAVRKVGPDREAIKNELATVKDFPGIDGPLSFGEDRRPKVQMYVYQIQNGAYEQIGTCKTVD